MAQRNETPIIILSLFITFGLVGAGAWWLLQRFSGNLSTVFQSAPSGNLSGGQAGATTLAQIKNVPSGLFNYGGSTTWAPIRGQVDSVIQTTFPNFKLRYVNPSTGTPSSGKGIQMLIDNQLSFSQSSRSLKPEEYQSAEQRGFKLAEVPVALEGIAIAVNPGLPISGLTLDQVKGIYIGQITNWNQVGGPDLPITPYSRQPDGGTVEFFVANILGGQPLGQRVQLIGTTTEALRKLARNPGGIYYASAPEVVTQCTIKPIAIGTRANELIAPYNEPLILPSQCSDQQRNQLNEAVIQNGQYPITRRLFVIVKQNGQVDQQAGEAYVNLLLTQEGQELLSKAGFVSIR